MASGRFRFAVLMALAAAGFAVAGGAAQAASGPLSLAAFGRETGIRASAEQVQEAWAALESMGTTKYLGGMLGGLRLDESAMIAGVLSIGAGEFDALLNGGGLNTASTTAGTELVSAMTSAAGIDLSYLTGSYTEGGGGSVSARAASASGATAGAEACDAGVSSEMASNGKAYVDGIVQAAMSGEYGFSKIQDLNPTSGSGTGFAALGCLDKLFQNAGSDLLFKPPSLGSLTTQLQNWVCGEAASVAEQVAGAFGNGEIFNTASLGGFYPGANFGEAFDSNPNQRLGMGQKAADTFGQSFANFEKQAKAQVEAAADITRLFK